MQIFLRKGWWGFFLLALLTFASCGSPAAPTTVVPPDRGHLIYTIAGDNLSAFYSKTGEQKWQTTISALSSSSGFSSPHVLATNDLVYCTSNNTLYAVATKNGKVQWSQPLPSDTQVTQSNLATDGHNVYLVAEEVAMAFGASNGTLRWHTKIQPPTSITSLNGFRGASPQIIVQAGLFYTNADGGGLRCRPPHQQWQRSMEYRDS